MEAACFSETSLITSRQNDVISQKAIIWNLYVIWYWIFQLLLKSEDNNKPFTWRPELLRASWMQLVKYLMDRKMFRTNVVKKNTIRSLCTIAFPFFFVSRAVFETIKQTGPFMLRYPVTREPLEWFWPNVLLEIGRTTCSSVMHVLRYLYDRNRS
jgi:hypothetical protein